jgi:hypothetical protein
MIPVENRTHQEYLEYVSSLPIQFEGERNITASGDGYVEVEGTIEGFEEVAVRENT